MNNRKNEISFKDPVTNDEHPAYCGFDCGRCPVYRATVDNDVQLKKELIKKYSTPERQLTEADISCLGCKAEKRYLHAYCEECAIRRCAVEHGCCYNCGECESYPCGNMKECFEVTKSFEPKCREVCTEEEYSRLKKAFFEKELNLKE